jgi:hypothetical protein
LTIYHKTVRYKLHWIEANNYRPEKSGINVTFGDYDHVNHEVTVHYACSDGPLIAPGEQRTMDDIEDEIRRMEPRLVKDTHVDLNLPFHYAIKMILDHKDLDGQYDYLRSVAVMKHPVMLPKVEIKQVNKFYNREVLKEDQEIFEVGEVIE